MMFGAIEAGGTEFVCAVGTGPTDALVSEPIPTTTPAETLQRVLAFFRAQGPLQAVGIGTFGPVDLNPASPTWGYITTTPKPGWANIPFAPTIRDALGLPVHFDTDVNVAALGEHRWGAAQEVQNFIYLTIGTGIGGGVMVGGRLLHGLIHPEIGHMLLPRDPAWDPYEGGCPYHRSCLEGLANGPALQARWGVPGKDLPPDHEAWTLEAHYLGLALANLTVCFSPERLVLGGGVMRQTQLFPLVRKKVQYLLNGYVQHALLQEGITQFVVPPALGDHAGVLGALALAQQGHVA
ncbi:MAG: ROK family protein [Anaerolineae bacterium]|nr:ROK family protein [Anaerolineae bacterium]